MSLSKKIILFILTVCLTISWHIPAESQISPALKSAIAAQEFYSQGELSKAAIGWQAAVEAYEIEEDFLGKTKSLINQAQVLQDLGLYPKACDSLLEALEARNPECNNLGIDLLMEDLRTKTRISTLEGIGLRSLGTVLRHRGLLDKAKSLLELSEIATQDTDMLGGTLLELGNVERALANRDRDRSSYDKITEIIDRQDPKLALKPYQKAFIAYQKTAADKQALPISQVQAQLNYLNLLIEIEDWWQKQTNRRIDTWQRQKQVRSVEAATNFSELLNFRLSKTKASLLNAIDRNWHQIPPSHQSIYSRINYSRSLIKLNRSERAKSVLQTALSQAKTIGDKLGESYALGYLGQYYAKEQQINRAIALTNLALTAAQTKNSDRDTREITYLWQSQLGQLLEQQGKNESAISAYTNAFNNLQSLRSDLNANDRVVQLDFRQEVKPVYLHLADLLLQSDRPQALESLELVAHTSDYNPNLELARQVIESLQVAELDNFFQDPCSEVANTTITIDRLDSQAAVIYPIVLSDRLDVILSLPNRPLQRFSTVVSRETVERTIDLLYDNLYNPSVDKSAVNIFRTTLLNSEEVRENMQTLLPLFQELHGWLIRPLLPSLTEEKIKTLVFVLNGRLQNVPISALYDGQQYLLEQYGIALVPSLQLLDPEPLAKDKTKVLAAGLSQQVEIQGNIFPALNNVPQELERIKAIFPKSRQLLDLEFTTNKIKQQLESGLSMF